jgi:hypothetical protein
MTAAMFPRLDDPGPEYRSGVTSFSKPQLTQPADGLGDTLARDSLKLTNNHVTTGPATGPAGPSRRVDDNTSTVAIHTERKNGSERRSRTVGSINPARSNARYTADSDGTGDTWRLANSNTNRRGPQYGRERRSSNTVASTWAGI